MTKEFIRFVTKLSSNVRSILQYPYRDIDAKAVVHKQHCQGVKEKWI